MGRWFFLNQREEIIAIAEKEIGYKEYQGNNNKYGVWYGLNNQPWCDIFVSWCAAQAGLQNIIPKNAYVPDRMAYYKKLNAFYKRGTYTPKPGDLVLFDFSLNGTPDHIGFSYEVKGSTLTTIEGNTTKNGESSNGDGVYKKSRNINSSTILGYCVPAYEEEDDVMRYQKLSEIPSWGKETVEKLMDKGIIQGNTKGLDLSEDMLRILVYNDRAGLYD